MPFRILGKNESGYYIKKAGSDFALEKFDFEMNRIWTKTLAVNISKHKDAIYEKIIMTDKKNHIIYM